MKLLSMYVDNFGKLSGFTYNFESSMNTIYEENGWGKSTFAAFIKAMLYGLDRDSRTKYTPWTNMASFGGTLVVESKGKQYRIERSFSPKRPSLDTLKVYDINSGLEKTFKNEIGEEFLNLNDESFERSVFIPQWETDEGFNSDIEAKLANLIGGTDDSQTFDDAIEQLTNHLHLLKLNSKKGLIIDKKKELFDVETEINEASELIKSAEDLRKSVDKLDIEIDKQNEIKNNAKNQLINYSKNQDKKIRVQQLMNYENEVKEAEDELFENDTILNGVKVTSSEIDSVQEKNSRLEQLKFEYEILKNSVSIPELYTDLIKTYNKDTVPTEEKLDSMERKIEKYNGILSVIEAHRVIPKEDKPIAGIVLAIISSLFLIAGLGIALYGVIKDMNKMFIITSGSLGAVALIGYIFAFLRFRKTSDINTERLVGGNVKAYDFEKRELEESMREFFGKFHLYSSDFANNLNIVRVNTSKYNNYVECVNLSKRGNLEIESRIKYLSTDIKKFLDKFIVPTDVISDGEGLQLLHECMARKTELETRLAYKVKERDEFIKENHLDNIENDDIDIDLVNSNLESADKKLDSLINERIQYMTRLSDVDDEIRSYEDLLKKKSNLESEIKKMENQYRLMTLSLEYLTQSQNSLLEKYVKPMKDSVKKYIELILKKYKDYSIDVNFKFRFVTDSGAKELGYYSKGFQSIIALCMRLALIDCLYPDEKPFVVLDDPFVNYDDEKMDLCKKLIKEVAKNYQVVYFTCHESRKI